MRKLIAIFVLSSILCSAGIYISCAEEPPKGDPDALDTRVRQFMQNHWGTWHDLNVPEADGQALHDIILEHEYKDALEIGTSTGYSTIWIAWALSKTGGKVITVEIDKQRHEEALTHFREAGLDTFIDARLGDAHTIVPALDGPFDFVFCDADTAWGPGNIVWGDFPEDVLFCSECDLRIDEDSPAVGAGENGETLGAWPVGCDVVPIEVGEVLG